MLKHAIIASMAISIVALGTSMAAAQPGHGHGFGHSHATVGSASAWTGGMPPGFSSPGLRRGWVNGQPRGWTQGQKRGWNGSAVPPGWSHHR